MPLQSLVWRALVVLTLVSALFGTGVNAKTCKNKLNARKYNRDYFHFAITLDARTWEEYTGEGDEKCNSGTDPDRCNYGHISGSQMLWNNKRKDGAVVYDDILTGEYIVDKAAVRAIASCAKLKHAKIALVCRSGYRSELLQQALVEAGMECGNVYNIDGGIMNYYQDGSLPSTVQSPGVTFDPTVPGACDHLQYDHVKGMVNASIAVPHLPIGVTFSQGLIDLKEAISELEGLRRLKDAGIKRLKLFQSDTDILDSIKQVYSEEVSRGEVIVQMQNVDGLEDTWRSRTDIQKRQLEKFVPYKDILKYMAIGNEPILTAMHWAEYNDEELPPLRDDEYSKPLRLVQEALNQLGMNDTKAVICFSAQMFINTYPPSATIVDPQYETAIRGVIDHYKDSKAPFFVNIYPIFALVGNPEQIPAHFATCDSSSGKPPLYVDGLEYDCLFDSMYDGMVIALRKLGWDGEVKVSETGWASAGHEQANLHNAKTYMNELIRRTQMSIGTPAFPGKPIEFFMFQAFDEGGKTGSDMERNFGIWTQRGGFKYTTPFHAEIGHSRVENILAREGNVTGTSDTDVEESVATQSFRCIHVILMVATMAIMWW